MEMVAASVVCPAPGSSDRLAIKFEFSVSNSGADCAAKLPGRDREALSIGKFSF
jgi:hypothetical protein